jgi:hypothetical protein
MRLQWLDRLRSKLHQNGVFAIDENRLRWACLNADYPDHAISLYLNGF